VGWVTYFLTNVPYPPVIYYQMKFSIRRSVHFDDFSQWLSGLEKIPIELALPHDMQEFWSIVGRLDELKEYVRDNNMVVNSVHAPHGRLSANAFLSWALPVMRFSFRVSARFCVFHPENHVAKARKPDFQTTALSYIKTVQTKTSVPIAIETLTSDSRLFTPGEIVQYNLPMALNTSHTTEEQAIKLIEQYSGDIVDIRLSEDQIGPGFGKALPGVSAEGFGLSVIEALKVRKWSGSVTLEYLPENQDRLIPDRARLESMFG
jgi:hypothetical protein